jgi:hypothetical protein
LLYFGDGGPMNYLPKLALYHDPPNLSLPSSPGLWAEATVPSCVFYLLSYVSSLF